jgi:hypothetical protein
VLGFFITLWLSKGIGFLHGQWAKTMLVGRFEGAGAYDAPGVVAQNEAAGQAPGASAPPSAG